MLFVCIGTKFVDDIHAECLQCKSVRSSTVPGSESMNRLVTTKPDIRVYQRLSILNTLILH